MLIIDKFSRKPIYEQIVEGIEKEIMMGILREREQLPSIRELSALLGVNPNTIQKAYTELEREGFIYSVKGRGNFVASTVLLRKYRQDEIKQQIKTLVREAMCVGLTKEEIIDCMKDDLKEK